MRRAMKRSRSHEKPPSSALSTQSRHSSKVSGGKKSTSTRSEAASMMGRWALAVSQACLSSSSWSALSMTLPTASSSKTSLLPK